MKLKISLMAMLMLGTIFSSRAQQTQSNAPAGTNAAVAEKTFKVGAYHIDGNTVFPPEKFDFLTNYTGPAVTWARLTEGLGKLQLLYRNLGFVTISVTLPPQRLTNDTVVVKVIEGKLERINIVSNRFFTSNNIVRALPSLTTNILINSKWLQPELDRANLNPDRQIYPVVAPGVDPGYTDLDLEVKDRLPLHGHIEVNDKSTPQTPLVRIDSALQYNNLWQLNHQLGFDYTFSPQTTKPDNHSESLYDEPMVASYSFFYRIPFGSGARLREDYERLPVDFGYAEITHRFNLPPPSGSPELIVYASRSSSETTLADGPLKTIVATPVVQITSQSAEQDLTVTENVGAKYNIPLQEIAGFRSSLAFGIDFKSYRANAFSTNLSYFNIPITNNGVISSSSFTVPLPSNTHHELTYEPLSLGWSGDRVDQWGSWSFSYGQNIFLSPLASSRRDFQSVAGSSTAGGNYTSASFNVTREQDLPHNWSVLFHGDAHWSSAPLISNEQFPLGGTAGVRGYQEGENYSDDGWRMTLDLRAPAFNIGGFPVAHGNVPAFVRPSYFMDYGEGYLIGRPGTAADRQWGTGVGAFLSAGQHFDARLTLGWALLSTPTTSAGGIQAYFSMGTQF